MRWGVVVCAAVAVLALGGAKSARAQLPQRAIRQVGFCDIHPLQQRMRLDDVATHWPNGFVEKAMFLLPPPLAGQPIPVALDPSGINFLAVRSAIHGVQFWIQWDFRVISIAPNGSTRVVGDCAVDPLFAASFLRPKPTTPTRMIDLSMNVGDETVTPNAVGPSELPQGMYEEGFYSAPPVMATKILAENCKGEASKGPQAFYGCVIGGTMGEKEKRAYECARSSKSPQEIALCLVADNLGAEERKNLQRVRDCYGRHADNWNQYPMCLAEASVDPKVMNLVSCARQNLRQGQEPNYWSLGVCALGPEVFASANPNPESSIAIQCAIQTRGQPKLFVACTGGQLAIRELDKCLTDGFGENGCFGKNNTLTKLYDAMSERVADAFGRKSMAYQAWQLATMTSNPAEARRAMNNVAREVNRAGDNVKAATKRALSQVIPQVVIGRPKGKMFGKEWRL